VSTKSGGKIGLEKLNFETKREHVKGATCHLSKSHTLCT